MKMPGRSATEMIWFMVSVIVAISLMGVFVGIAYQYSDTIQQNARGEAADYKVNVEIINDPRDVPYDDEDGELTIYAKNTGTYELDKDQSLVIVNGEPHAEDELEIEMMGDSSAWTQGSVARINITVENLEENQDHRVNLEVQGIFQGERLGRDSDSIKFHL